MDIKIDFKNIVANAVDFATLTLLTALILISQPGIARSDIYSFVTIDGVETFTDAPLNKQARIVIKDTSKKQSKKSTRKVKTEKEHTISLDEIIEKTVRSANNSDNTSIEPQLPLVGGYITSGVGLRVDPIDGKMRHHNGIDIAIREGTPVTPAAAGVVVYSGLRSGYGYALLIEHNNGMVTLYGHNSRLLVTAGQHVDKETTIALSGNTGRSTGPHLHFEAWQAGVNVTPAFMPGSTMQISKTQVASYKSKSIFRKEVLADGSILFYQHSFNYSLMLDQINKYSDKLFADRSANKSEIAFAALDDSVVSSGETFRANLASDVINRLGCLSLLVATPSLPFAELLLRRTKPGENRIIPRDTETRTFLHDIPILRKTDFGKNLSEKIAELLSNRKGVIIEGIGIIAAGSLTVEQAYINWSSIFHSTFIKYLEDILADGFLLPGEAGQFDHFRTQWLRPLTSENLTFRTGPLDLKNEILDEIAKVGAYTVQRGLVDSFFGNISYRNGDLVFISQTAASLDELAGCIDPVPFSNSSTVGITASSELVAHQRIYLNSDCLAILHGHPRFSVVMSMLCAEQPICKVTDCWRDCKKTRYLGGTPVVAGEIGAGGLAKNVPPVITENGRAIVYGHGVFSIGKKDFKEAFQALVDVENWCRNEYFRILDLKLGS